MKLLVILNLETHIVEEGKTNKKIMLSLSVPLDKYDSIFQIENPMICPNA